MTNTDFGTRGNSRATEFRTHFSSIWNRLFNSPTPTVTETSLRSSKAFEILWCELFNKLMEMKGIGYIDSLLETGNEFGDSAH